MPRYSCATCRATFAETPSDRLATDPAERPYCPPCRVMRARPIHPSPFVARALARRLPAKAY